MDPRFIIDPEAWLGEWSKKAFKGAFALLLTIVAAYLTSTAEGQEILQRLEPAFRWLRREPRGIEAIEGQPLNPPAPTSKPMRKLGRLVNVLTSAPQDRRPPERPVIQQVREELEDEQDR